MDATRLAEAADERARYAVEDLGNPEMVGHYIARAQVTALAAIAKAVDRLAAAMEDQRP